MPLEILFFLYIIALFTSRPFKIGGIFFSGWVTGFQLHFYKK